MKLAKYLVAFAGLVVLAPQAAMAEQSADDEARTSYEAGLEIFRAVYGDAMADGVVALSKDDSKFGNEQARMTLEWPFGQIWTRDGLDPKLRSCTVLGMLIGMGAAEEIKFHVIMGLHNGLTRDEIEEIFYTSVPYAGFPASNTAREAMLAGFKLADELAAQQTKGD